MLGSTASKVLHEAPCSVLLARPVPRQGEFPARIVLATDGSTSAAQAAEVAARIAGRHGAATMVVSPGLPAEIERRHIAGHTALLTRATGTEPVLADSADDGPAGIVQAAGAFGAGLIVMGARGLRGLRALGSVSERVAHVAPCSVLVVRGPSSFGR
jgi:nucleotide-binding universal stress UspA family protein